MKSHLRTALTLFLLLTLLTGGVYPLLVTLIAQGVFPHRANGSIVERGGKPVGSELIGQQFDEMHYFWGRPSATQKDDKDLPYNAAASSGSNLGPTNGDLAKAVKERVENLRAKHPDQKGPVPVDLVTASASGLDPHISPAAAEYQVTRVARKRNMKVEDLRRLIAANTEGRTFGVLGEPRVNVLRLNLALDSWSGNATTR
jgi:K+-transporting ATPase ATPase C chain